MAPDLHAQEPSATESKGSFTFAYANDFFRATDRYFTQGVRLELAAPFVVRSPIRLVLPSIGERDNQQHALFVEQNCYTPRSIRRDTVLRDDRPFAAALFIAQRRMSVDAEHGRLLNSAFLLGVLGPCAVCAEEQRAIHDALENITPIGWEFQVASDVIANLDLELKQRLLRARFLEVSLAGAARAGTFHDRIGIGGKLEVGRFRSHFGGERKRNFELSVFTSGQVDAVLYDATLQGGLFNHSSVHTVAQQDVERLIGRGELGARMTLGGFDFHFAHVYTTRDFRGGMPHAWGDARITFNW